MKIGYKKTQTRKARDTYAYVFKMSFVPTHPCKYYTIELCDV